MTYVCGCALVRIVLCSFLCCATATSLPPPSSVLSSPPLSFFVIFLTPVFGAVACSFWLLYVCVILLFHYVMFFFYVSVACSLLLLVFVSFHIAVIYYNESATNDIYMLSIHVARPILLRCVLLQGYLFCRLLLGAASWRSQ